METEALGHGRTEHMEMDSALRLVHLTLPC